jgi:nicotinate phosphoribosyltransferase
MFESRITMTDGYKFSMAEAGFPLRTETFYYTHRKGGINGWHYMPLDAKQYIKDILPHQQLPDFPTIDLAGLAEDYKYLEDNHYAVGAGYRKAFSMIDTVKTLSIPKGSWFYNREPAFSVTGPSAVASWLEPIALMLNFVIQVATQARLWMLPNKMFATCEEERDGIINACELAGRKPPTIEVRADEYYQHILTKAKDLVVAVVDPNRIFEVGMRAVSCMNQHRVALSACKEAGILRTSNVYLAKELGMIPVGTMGHEHIQRFGNDYQAFITMRDRFPGFISYLPDTFDTIRSGIPAALKAIQECPDRLAGIRFDSEERIRNHYFYALTECQRLDLAPQLILESGWNLEKTVKFEKYRETAEWPASLQSYGYGGYLVAPPWQTFQRDDVAAIWKLTQSGSMATMKFGDEANSGKQSAPGLLVIYRPSPMTARTGMPVGWIAQEGEKLILHGQRPDYYSLSGLENYTGAEPDFKTDQIPPVYSPATQALVDVCQANRQANFNIGL